VATVPFLQKLYGMPPGLTVRYGSTNALAEFYGEFWSEDDLDAFLDLSGVLRGRVKAAPWPVYGDLPNNPYFPGLEANLDAQYMAGLSPNATTSFYSVADRNPYSYENEGFLAWLFFAGCQENPPLVHSLSYADEEWSLFAPAVPNAAEYARRMDDEFVKLALRGVTVIAASGDDGAAGPRLQVSFGAKSTDACESSSPQWPASSPYVTSVGATTLSNKHHAACSRTYGYNVVCSARSGSLITSGGGFSNVYPQPPWQAVAVDAYLANEDVIPTPPGWFNRSGRGYPDVSAYGSMFLIVLRGRMKRESGTSASTPVLAAMCTLWNDMRLAHGLPPVGFIAPMLYYT
ncbi:unnamed protein product, partial [Phaeothamnion confervicola]